MTFANLGIAAGGIVLAGGSFTLCGVSFGISTPVTTGVCSRRQDWRGSRSRQRWSRSASSSSRASIHSAATHERALHHRSGRPCDGIRDRRCRPHRQRQARITARGTLPHGPAAAGHRLRCGHPCLWCGHSDCSWKYGRACGRRTGGSGCACGRGCSIRRSSSASSPGAEGSLGPRSGGDSSQSGGEA